MNFSTFEFDKNKIISLYRDEGFVDVKVSYILEKSSLNNNILYYYIKEGKRIKIQNVDFKFKDDAAEILNKISSII